MPRPARYVARPSRSDRPVAGHSPRDSHHDREIPPDQLRDLTLGTARRDRVACQGRRVRSDVHQPPREAGLVSRDLPPRQGAGAVRRREAAVRVERDRRVPRRDGAAPPASRGPDQAGAKPGLDRLRPGLLGRLRPRVLRRGRGRPGEGDGSRAPPARQARRGACEGAGQRRTVLQRAGALSRRRGLRPVLLALRLRRGPARLRVAEGVPPGPGVVGRAARERTGRRLGRGLLRS